MADTDPLIVLYKNAEDRAFSINLFSCLRDWKVPNHFIERLNDHEILVHKLAMIPIKLVLRNGVDQALSRRTGLPEGSLLKRPIIEYYYGNTEDSLVNEDHILLCGWASDQEIINMRHFALQANEAWTRFFALQGRSLIDFKIEFGRYKGDTTLGGALPLKDFHLREKDHEGKNFC